MATIAPGLAPRLDHIQEALQARVATSLGVADLLDTDVKGFSRGVVNQFELGMFGLDFRSQLLFLENRNVSQGQIGQALGISRAAVSRLYSGKMGIRAERVKLMEAQFEHLLRDHTPPSLRDCVTAGYISALAYIHLVLHPLRQRGNGEVQILSNKEVLLLLTRAKKWRDRKLDWDDFHVLRAAFTLPAISPMRLNSPWFCSLEENGPIAILDHLIDKQVFRPGRSRDLKIKAHMCRIVEEWGPSYLILDYVLQQLRTPATGRKNE